MGELTLRWSENGQVKTKVLSTQAPSKSPGTIRIGRDPAHCDLVLAERSVSGLHVEITWHPQEQVFYLRNLRATNPPAVNGVLLTAGTRRLYSGHRIQLGRLELTVVDIATPAPAPAAPVTPGAAHLAGLKCPNPACQQVSPYENAALHCPWCGFSLAGAETIFGLPPQGPITPRR